MADTTTIPPRHPSVLPLRAQIPFRNFRYPFVNSAEDVTFIADDRDRDAHQHGIYRSMAASNELKPLVVKGQPTEADPASQFDYIRGLQMDGDDFVFNATLTGRSRGLFHWSNGKVTTVARTRQTILPDQNLPLTNVEYGALKNGRILYQATDPAGTALVLFDTHNGKSRVLLRTGTPIPGRTGDEFKYLSPQHWIDEESVVFRAARVTDPRGSPTKENGNTGVYGWFGVDWKKPDAFALAKLITIADWTTPVPPDGGGTFTHFDSAPIARGLIAFQSTVHASSHERAGVYFTSIKPNGHHSTAAIRNIVDTATEIDSLFKGPFTDFDRWVEVMDGAVLFIGCAESGPAERYNYVGVFLYKPDHDELFLLCDNRQPIDGKAVGGFELGANFWARNRLAVTIHFKDGSSGVYLATIPPQSFRRMTTGR